MMEKTIELSTYLKILEEVNNLPEIEKAEIIEPPEDTEADISLRLKLKPNINKWIVQEKIQKIRWKYSKEYEPITLYLEFF
ncbi:MAG: hypothetical protein GXO45_02580 [Aquificae bacterium]|nr:hypothetical protein [Aquificota bacterium]